MFIVGYPLSDSASAIASAKYRLGLVASAKYRLGLGRSTNRLEQWFVGREWGGGGSGR